MVTSVVIARLYGIEIVGQYALVIAPTSALWFLSTTGEQIALSRELAKLQPREPRVTGLLVAVLSYSFALSLVVGIAIFSIVVLLYRGPINQPEILGPTALNMAGCIIVANTSWNLDRVLSSFVAGKELFPSSCIHVGSATGIRPHTSVINDSSD